MPPKIVIKPDDRYNRLVVIEEVEPYIDKRGHRIRRVKTRCDCGTVKVHRINSMRSGMTQSCGCLNAERRVEARTRHGMCGTPTYMTWGAAKYRATRRNGPEAHNYVNRGITMCDRWLNSFENFYEDMGERPPGMTLERINTNGHYEPSNCKWLSGSEQPKNMRKCKWWFVHGVKYASMTDAAKALGIHRVTVRQWCQGRIANGIYYPPKPNCWSELKYPQESAA